VVDVGRVKDGNSYKPARRPVRRAAVEQDASAHCKRTLVGEKTAVAARLTLLRPLNDEVLRLSALYSPLDNNGSGLLLSSSLFDGLHREGRNRSG
jgi:hypothetical protein